MPLFRKNQNSAKPGSQKRTRLVTALGIFVLVALSLLVINSFIQRAEGKSMSRLAEEARAAPAIPAEKLTGEKTKSAYQALPPLGPVIGKLLPLENPPESANRVTIGIFINNVYELDTSSNTYFLGGYIWLRWQGDFDPVENLEFPNAVDEWGLTKALLDESQIVLPDGSNYQIMRIQGRFFQPYDLQNYPLDKQELALYVENSNETLDQVVYLPDNLSMGYDESMIIPGWDVNGLHGGMFAHDYGTNFGQIGVAEASKYSTLKFSLELSRVKNLFAFRLLLPLLIVLLTNWLALLLKPTLIDVRTALPATALLTLVFLQQSSLEAIPQVSTLVLMDKIYAMAYILVVLTFSQIVWANSHVNEDESGNTARIRNIEFYSFIGQITLFATGLVLLVTAVT
jgi:hypothetical protein